MEVHNRFSDQGVISKFNQATVSEFSRPKTDGKSAERKFTFADIGGLEEQKEELRKYILRPLSYPEVYKNIRLNKGILLYGPPRCGKTLLGKALANEADVKFQYMNANEWISETVGSSEENIRKTFSEIISEPHILFIDEFDAVGKQRDGSATARYQDPVVNQLLGCLSDLEKSYTNSFVIAATNRRDLIDKALLDSGRFGLQLEIPMPDEKSLGEIYDIHSRNLPLRGDISKPFVVEYMLDNNFNGSDVAEMFSVGYFNALERLGMNAKMDAKAFRFEDLKRIEVSTTDLMQAINKIGAQKVRKM
jgi:transitional endoplasmic reticulum ATPase